MTPQDRARTDIVDYCLTKRDRWHGYDSIPGQVDHDLANAYASIAEALSEQQPGDFAVVCDNGCPEGAQGRHKFSCPLASRRDEQPGRLAVDRPDPENSQP